MQNQSVSFRLVMIITMHILSLKLEERESELPHRYTDGFQSKLPILIPVSFLTF